MTKHGLCGVTLIATLAFAGDRTSVDFVWYVCEKGPNGKITDRQIGS
jgi:hypothetical protein